MGPEGNFHRANMMRAIDLARKGNVGGWQIGAVLARADGSVIATGYRGESGGQIHAESLAIQKAQTAQCDLRDTTAYVTLEPCANLESKNKKDCSTLLAEVGVRRVFIGSYDLNPRIYRLGWRNLRDAGVELRDFPTALRTEVQSLGPDRQADFRERKGREKGRVKFDYTQNGGRYDIHLGEQENAPRWTTKWGQRGANSIYALGGTKGVVAEARFARSFSEIDDPDVFDFGSHFAPIKEGEIAVFRNEYGHLLVKVLEVQAGPERGTEHFSLKFEYEIRLTGQVRD
ncbi:deaminase [Streptomyces sp. CA-251251]|uniref:deaminase n=1 Tax=Streptomyces sp. CA-251251 TaxID=3240063 RepID=UPI003D918587